MGNRVGSSPTTRTTQASVMYFVMGAFYNMKGEMDVESVFFQATRDALDNITAAFDFVHPLRASMLYTRRKLSEINASVENADDIAFQAVVDPEHLVHGVGYRESFINTAWENQEEQLAWLLLNNLFAIHEGWAQRLYFERFGDKGYKEGSFIKRLQYEGLEANFTSYYAIRGKRSDVLKAAYFDVYKDAVQLDFSKLENYMLLYRYYKEARNCYMHRNIIASQNVVGAYNHYLPIATLSDLDTKEVPIIVPPVLGQPLKLSLRGVIGFSQFVRRILIITDINLIQTSAAEDEFLSNAPDNRETQILSNNPTKAKMQIAKYSTKAGFLKPKWSKNFQNFLISKEIFKIEV